METSTTTNFSKDTVLVRDKIILWLKEWYPLCLIIILALSLRIWLLTIRGDFSFDEMFSTHFSSLSWAESLKYWVLETNPPLHTLLLRFWIVLFGNNETTVRILSTFWSTASIVLTYLLARRYFDKSVAILSSLLLSLSTITIFLDTEARTYSLLIFLIILSSSIFLKIINSKQISKKSIIFYFLIQTLLLYSHLTAVLIPFIQVVFVWFNKDINNKNKKTLIVTNIISGLLFCIWFLPSILGKLHINTFNGWFFNGTGTEQLSVLASLINLFVTTHANSLLNTLLEISLIVAIIALVTIIRKSDKQTILVYLVVWAIVPPLLASMIGISTAKYIALSIIPLAIILAITISNIKIKLIKTSVIILLSAIIIPSSLTIASTTALSWQPITEHIKRDETDKSIIMITPFNEELVLQKYYKGNTPILGIYPTDDGLSLDERIVRYNWQMFNADIDIFDKWMTDHIQNKDKIFYIQYAKFLINLAPDWLLKKGWVLYDYTRINGYYNIYLFEFHAPNYSPTSTSPSPEL